MRRGVIRLVPRLVKTLLDIWGSVKHTRTHQVEKETIGNYD